MKKCPYCGHVNVTESNICERCKAGFPHDEPKKTDNPDENVRVSKRKMRGE